MDALSSAASGMLADERLQQVIMNNISNLTTPGFKSSTGQLMAMPTEFVDRLSGAAGQGGVEASLGAVQNGAVFQEAVSNFAPGTIQSTGQPLDLAIADPVQTGTSVYALVPTPGATTTQKAQVVSSSSFVVGTGGVIETVQGHPILPVNASGAPLTNARVIRNPKFKGLDLFGESGQPVVDSAGQPSYTIVNQKGQPIGNTAGQPSAYLQMTSSSTGGVHSFFPVLNVDAQGKLRVALTRDGHFQVGSNQLLENATGQRVLAVSSTGQPLLNSAIRINPQYTGSTYFGKNGQPIVDTAGQPSYTVVSSTGVALPQASFQPVATNVNSLQPLGISDFVLTSTSTVTKSNATVRAGALEASNVNDTQSMVDMIAVYRSYAANQKMVQSMDTVLQQTVESVGTVANL